MRGYSSSFYLSTQVSEQRGRLLSLPGKLTRGARYSTAWTSCCTRKSLQIKSRLMAGNVLLKVSVGRRLFLLVALQTAIAVLLVITAWRYLSEIAADTEYMYRFQLLTIADLGQAHRHAAMLQTLTRPDAAKLGYQAPPE